ncbi:MULTISPECIES: hypothetical protein [unclassified Paenibacillus]|nr:MULTISPECIES: hypothetical protein [unclassified Paenibacillus]ETT48705.1 hypothetical protein C162_13818 [Paenibacillus sp. FSL R7-269]OMF99356.1 hypothetical protein BK147_07205 [Paenibacillus sp. FSL R7-0337]
MGDFYKILETDMELLAAALSEVPVAVLLKSGTEEQLETGPIRAYTPQSVRIRGLSYCRELHQFRILAPGSACP